MSVKCQSLLSQLESIGKQDPNRVAIYWQTHEISYGELWEMVLAEANQLPKEPGMIAIHMQRSPKLIATLLACWLKGHAYCALDPTHPEQRKKLILEDLKPNTWVSDVPYSFIANNSKITVPNDLAYILYTSGSTGHPKGVMISEHSVNHLLNWACELYDSEQLAVTLASTTITFDLSVFELFVPLMAGTSIALVDSILDLVDISPNKLPPISLINTVPSAMREIARIQAIPGTCQTINLAGEALDQTLVNELYAHPSVKAVYNLWGPSEDTTYSTVYLCGQGEDLPQAVPIGRPLPETEITLLDNEILLSGPGICLGYWNRPDLNNQCFGFSESGKRFYRTGDLGYWDKNLQLRFSGRKDFQVKVRGYRIEVEDIEAQSYQIPHIREAVVSIIEKNNIPSLALLAYSDDITLEPKTLKKELSRRLPRYMVPELIDVVYQPLAKTPNGKLCRSQAKSFWLHTKLLPQEKLGLDTLSQIAESILNCALDPEESFINQGGNSLLAVQFKHALQTSGLGYINLNQILDVDTSLSQLESILYRQVTEKPKMIDLRPLVDSTHWRAWQVKGSAYHVAITCSISGSLDVNRLAQSIEKMVTKSSSFTHQLPVDNIKLDTTPHPPKVLTFPTNKTNHEQLLQHIQELIFEKPFDLNKKSCIRFALVHSESLTHVLICAPHFILDGYGLEAMLKSISAFYSGKTMVLSNKQSMLRSDHKSSNIEAYLEKLSGSYEAVVFPSQRLDASPTNHSFWLSKQQVTQLSRLVKQLKMSQASLTLGLFQLLLHYCLDYRTMVTAVPLANRNHDELNRINNQTFSIPVLSAWRSDISLKQFLKEQNQQLIHLIDEAPALFRQLEKNQAGNGLFDIFFSTMDFARDALQIDNCYSRLTFYNSNRKKAHLVCSMITETNGDMECRLESLSNLLSTESLVSLARCYEYLMENALTLLDTQLSELVLMPKSQYECIRQLNQPRPYSQDSRSLCQIIQAMTETNPHKIAISDNNQQLTYLQLRQSAQQIANYLSNNNITPGQGIGILLDRNASCVIAIIGILWAGCHYVPIDKRNPQSRRNSIIDRAEISFIIDANIIQASKQRPVNFNLAPEVHPLDLAYIIFTSGTTGEPKGVPIQQKHVLSLIAATKDKYQFGKNDKWSMFHSHAFDFSVWEIFGPLLTGGEVCIVAEDTANNPVNMIDFINQNKITVFSQTPTALKNILQIGSSKQLLHQPRLICFGGEALTQDIVDQWFEQYGTDSNLVNMYGITEVTVHASEYSINPKNPLISIGKPMSDMGWQLRGQLGQLMPIGFVGELWVSGVGVTDGYWHDTQLSKEKFVERNGQRFYRSGDLAWLNMEGLAFYIGRKDQQFQLNGHRLEKGDITTTIRNAEPFIQQIELVINTDQSGLSLLYAYYTADQTLSESKLIQNISSWLPSYATPSRWVQLEAFPLTMNGKIDIPALPKPVSTLVGSQDPIKKCSIEQKVKTCWETILGYPVEQACKAFFELGGNSLKAVRLSQELAQLVKDGDFTVVDIFRYPTLEQQINIIKQRMKEPNHA
tara:strand:+ start:1539 stop:6155 length:4617 start_codon:yes stop_codon:yes gene_type:complete